MMKLESHRQEEILKSKQQAQLKRHPYQSNISEFQELYMQQKVLKLSLFQKQIGLTDIKQILENLTTRLRSLTKEKRHDLTYYLRKTVTKGMNIYSVLERKDQTSGSKLMKKNQLDHLLLQLGENLNVLVNYSSKSISQRT